MQGETLHPNLCILRFLSTTGNNQQEEKWKKKRENQLVTFPVDARKPTDIKKPPRECVEASLT